ncbi:MAG: energy-coupling factor ABC transporter ATP-binding protein [Actinomycetota bacterium]|nr:energy-coupling factor ABC transporter ATP-binding protein [Actinomycetota bacterium]
MEESLRLVNISRHRFQHPENLSGGEKQLVAIASVLAMQPKVIIFDESLAPLDSKGRTRVKQVMGDLRDRGKTIILIDHDIRNLDLADRVFFLKQGKLKKIGLERTGDIAGLYRNG